MMIGNVAGLVVAGVIVNIWFIGAVGGFYIDAVTFFVSACLIMMMSRTVIGRNLKDDIALTRQALAESIHRPIITEIRAGVAYLMSSRTMRLVMFAYFLLMAGLGTISCVIIVFIQDAFGTSTRDLGFIGMFLVAGLFLGTLLFGKFGHRISKRTAVFLSFIASGVFITLFAIFVRRYPNILVAGMLSAMLGASASPIMIVINTLTHEAIPEDVRGRIFSSLEVVIHLSFLVFMFVAAFAAKFIDRFWIVVAAGAVFSLCGLAGLVAEERRVQVRP
jgi:MFS family permease